MLASLPHDACVTRVAAREVVDQSLVGPDGQPLVTRGTVVVIFTLDDQPFEHEFIVVEGGSLMLLGNDFIARYRASVTPMDSSGHVSLRLRVTRDGEEREINVTLTCQPPAADNSAAVATVAAAAPSRRAPSEITNEDGSDVLHDTGKFLPPALVELGGPTESPTPPDRTGPTADERLPTTLRTDGYLLYCDRALGIGPRTETTAWVRVPLQIRDFAGPVIIDRIPVREGLEVHCSAACGIAYIDSDGMVPVTLMNTKHKSITIPASSPIAALEVDLQIDTRDPIDASSTDPYERLSADERKLIDSIDVDAGGRLSPSQLLEVRNLLASHIRVFALNPKDPVHTHLEVVKLALKAEAVPHRHAASRLGETGGAIVDRECAEMEANGIIRKSNSAWGSRVVLVKKKDGTVRFCIDYRDLNRKLVTLDTPIPRCDEAFDRLS